MGFIPLGGSSNSSFLVGHNFNYVTRIIDPITSRCAMYKFDSIEENLCRNLVRIQTGNGEHGYHPRLFSRATANNIIEGPPST